MYYSLSVLQVSLYLFYVIHFIEEYFCTIEILTSCNYAKKKMDEMEISTGEKLIFLAVSSRSYTHKTFGQVLVPRAAIIELSLLTICGWRLELTFNFYSCDNLWFIEAWMRQWDRCYQLNLFLLISNLIVYYINGTKNIWYILRHYDHYGETLKLVI